MFEHAEFAGTSTTGLIDAIQAAHRAAAAAQATEVLAMTALYERQTGADTEYAAAAAALAVQSTEAAANSLVRVGVALSQGLASTREAFTAGRIDLARVRVIVEVTADLPVAERQALEPRLLAAAEQSNPLRLRQTARRWAMRLDPATAAQRRTERETGRSISVRAARDGMAVVEASLPAVTAQAFGSRLREMSLQVCKHDPRTKMQRRADAVRALADGSGRLACQCGRGTKCPAIGPAAPAREALVHVGVSAETLAGIRADPAVLAGYGPIDAGLAREIARHARTDTIRDDLPGQPPALRSGCLCRFPGCVTPAQTTPPRSGASAKPEPAALALCGHHSTLKTHADTGKSAWKVRHGAGKMAWITPGGHAVSAPDEDAEYLFPARSTGPGRVSASGQR